MANTNMKRCSTSVIKQIKTTMSYHLTPVRIVIKDNKSQVLWRKGNPRAQLVGL